MKLPVCSGKGAVRAFERAGWTADRQRGSHVSLFRPNHPVVLTVPLHRELGHGLLRDLIRKSGLTVEEFAEALKS